MVVAGNPVMFEQPLAALEYRSTRSPHNSGGQSGRAGNFAASLAMGKQLLLRPSRRRAARRDWRR